MVNAVTEHSQLFGKDKVQKWSPYIFVVIYSNISVLLLLFLFAC